MTRMQIRRFSAPDETRPFVDKGRLEVLHVGDEVIGRGIFEPGWRWSRHVKPLAQTASCEAEHMGYVLSGRMHVVMDDGQEAEIAPGDLVTIPPGHDAWTVGNEPCVFLDFTGFAEYARSGRIARDEAGRGAHPHH
jgi:quercetin dioxygenase-like cupin family protein